MIGDVGQRKQAFAYLAALVVAVAIIPPIANANPPSDLPESTQGTAAVAKFADRLDELATRYGLEKASFQALLQTDPDIWVDEDGALFYMDPPQAAGGVPPPLALAPFPYADTFKLHSLPGSNRTIYLDFDGETISGTAWNGGGSDINATPFDTDGNGASFTNSEQDYIQSVWQRVAEDFAPFDVDVTTEDPGFAAIDRNSYGDTVYGTRILITNIASSSICGGACGGVAYVGVFDKLPFGYPHSYYQPAWVFPNSLGSAKAVAEATSHEAGHNLSLYHDGTSAVSYYTGQGSWAPIMGVGYYRPIVQWSQGEYADANNSEDDIAKIVAGGAPLRTDDHGDTSGASTSLSGPSFAASGIISTRADVDVFGFSTTGGLVTITVDPAPTSPNLDISIELRDSGGTLLASDDPAVATISSDSASGLSATLSKTVPSGSYYIHVDGVGFGDPTGTGYSDYGSLGSYTLTGNVGTPVCNTLTSSTAGSGSFTRNPTNSSGCSSGEYYAGEDISLDATPVATWQLNLWSSVGEGSFADSGAEDTVFTMPASAVTVLATFGLIPIPLDCSAGACSFSFDAADDWTFSGLWHIETNATITGMNGGTLAFNTSCTGPGVTDCTYADGSSQTTGVATSPPLDVGSGKLLTFTTAREVEAQSPVCPSPQDWDQTYVEYSTNSGSTWSALTLTSISSSGQDIVANEICGEGLTAQTVTASVPVNTTHIRFIFDSVDHILNIFPGQFIDDVNLDDPGPTKLTFTQEPSGGAPGVAFPSQPVVAVQTDADTTDSGDNSTTVTLSLIGSGTLTCNGGLSKTVTSGVATFDGCSIDTVGSVQVHAVSSPTLTPADTASFTVTDSTRKLAFTSEPGSSITGAAFDTQPSVAVQDIGNVTQTSDNSTTVTLSLIGSGTLTCNGGLSKTVTSGVATFDGCSIDTVGSVQIHAVSSPTLTPADTASFTVTDSTRKLAFTSEPGSGTTGISFATQPVVAVQNNGGATQTSDNTTVVTLSLVGSGTFTCSGGLSKTASSGVATFTGCSVDTAGTVQIHAESSPALTPADTASFVIAGAGQKLAFTSEPGSGTTGISFATQPVVAVQNNGGATQTSDNTTVVTLSLVGSGTLTCDGGLSKPASSGVATFAGCSVDTAGGGLRLQATATAVADATSSSFSNVEPPAGGLWYLAEGFTGFGWSTELHILNPGALAANVAVTYLLDGGSPVVRHFTVNAKSHLTVDANDPAQGPGPDAAFGVRVASDRAIMVEEDMYAGDSGDFAHGTQATDTLSTTWYFAEGFTQFGWETFILVAVPGTSAADVTITYNVQGGAPVIKNVNVSAQSRFTFAGHTDASESTFSVTITSTQPVVAEMVMLEPGRRIAHRTIGVSAASTTWYLGEGFTGFGWETFISVGNPGNSEATVTATYNIDGEDPISKQIIVPAGSRGTFLAHDTFTGVGLDKAFGIVITSDKPVVVQEVLIDPAADASRAHSTMASPLLASTWTFSGGSAETGMVTFLTVANPLGPSNTVTAIYYFHDGSSPISENMVVETGRRGTFASAASVPAGKTFGVVLSTAAGDIVAQQVVYDELKGRAFSSSGSVGP